MYTITKLKAVFTALIACFLFFGASYAQDRLGDSKTLLLFADKSMQKDSLMNHKAQQFLKKKLLKFLSENDRKVCLSFIFENSASAGNRFCRKFFVEPIDKTRLDQQEIETLEIEHVENKLFASKRLIKSVLNYYKTDTRLAGSSAILSCISQISSTDSKGVEVIFFSDFIENSSIRNMYKKPLYNRETALQYANQDVKKLTKLFDLSGLEDKQISVLCMLTIDPINIRDSNAHLEDYWKEVFRLLGITQVKFSTLH